LDRRGQRIWLRKLLQRLRRRANGILERNKKMKYKKVSDYQKEYDKMKAIAESSLNANVEFDSSFYNELARLAKLIKSFGGKV
jgi:hypothetical protein